jgi:hypothetical protein
MTMQCQCGSTDFEETTRPHQIVVSGAVFDRALPASRCRACGMGWIALDDLAELEHDVARQLEAEGPFTEEARQFILSSRAG